MKYKELLFTIFIICCVISCKTSTELDEIYPGITETDETGQIIGNIDRNDWSENVYYNYYFGKNIWLYPNTNIYLTVHDSGQVVQKQLQIYNSGKSTTKINCSLNDPFICEPENISLSPNTLATINIKYIAIDTLSHSDSLLIKFSDDDTYTTKVQADYRRMVGIRRIRLTFSFFPAFPNPTSGSITFSFFLGKQFQKVNLYIQDNSGSVVKHLLTNDLLPPGAHAINWNVKEDHINPGFYRAYLEADTISAYGDIQIIE